MAKHQVTIPVFIPHLGCPHRCIFCDQWGTTAARELPGPERVDTLISHYMPRIKKSVSRVELAFFGGSFTGINRDIQESFLAAAHRHLAENRVHGIRLSTRPDYISNASLDLLRTYGVDTIELGVQSFDEKVLETAERGHTAADVLSAAGLIKEYGFNLVIQLMPGLPGETRESAMESAGKAADLRPAAVRIYPAVVLKGTRMEHLYREGTYSPLTLECAVDLCKDLYLLFRERDIPVIRLGLHPVSEARSDSIVAGPYHTSFGYLVKSRVRRDEMVACVRKFLNGDGAGCAENIHLVIPDTCTEEFIGNKKENIRYVKQAFHFNRIDYTVGPGSDMRIAPARPAGIDCDGGTNA